MAETAGSSHAPQLHTADGQGRVEHLLSNPVQAPQPASCSADHGTEQHREGPSPAAPDTANATGDPAGGHPTLPPASVPPSAQPGTTGQPALADPVKEALAMMVHAGANEAKARAALASVSQGDMDIEA